MTVRVRECDPDDFPSLEVIRRQSVESGFVEAYDRAAYLDLVDDATVALSAWIESDGHLALVVETDVTPVGFGVYDRTEGRILALCTAPEYAGLGCAGRLLDRFERAARDDGPGTVRVTTPLGSAGFFEENGFERVGTEDRGGLTLVRYEKSVG